MVSSHINFMFFTIILKFNYYNPFIILLKEPVNIIRGERNYVNVFRNFFGSWGILIWLLG